MRISSSFKIFLGLFLLFGFVTLISTWSELPEKTARADDRAEEEAVEYQKSLPVKTRSGLNFKVPEDWPVEERNGILAPIPTEEYLVKKFRDIGSQLGTIQQQLSVLELRVGAIEGQAKSKKQLRSSSQ